MSGLSVGLQAANMLPRQSLLSVRPERATQPHYSLPQATRCPTLPLTGSW